MGSNVAHAHQHHPDRFNPTFTPHNAWKARGAPHAVTAVCLALLEIPRLGGAAQPPVYVFEHVSVIAMDAPNLLAEQNVYVAGNTITTIRASANDVIPDHARRIEGSGRYL